MNLTVTVLAHDRPAYLRRTLAALAQCHGLKSWRVLLVADDPDPETARLVIQAAETNGWETALLNHRNAFDEPYARVSRATLSALALAFATADFVAHLVCFALAALRVQARVDFVSAGWAFVVARLLVGAL